MNVPGEQRDVTAADGSSAKRRRAAVQRVREARDRLTSATGTRPAFDGGARPARRALPFNPTLANAARCDQRPARHQGQYIAMPAGVRIVNLPR